MRIICKSKIHRATVTGARVVHREGYRFRSGEGDKLTDPDGWQASSHRGLRLPPRQPALLRLEPIATVGVVVHLADVKDDAMLTVEPRNKDFAKTDVSVKELLTGEPKQLWGGAAVVRRISAAMPVVTAKTEDDFPAACYGPDGTLWLAYISYTVKEESRRIEPPPDGEQR